MNEFNFVRKEKGAIVADLAGVGLIEYTYMHPDKGASIHFVPNKPRLETLAKSSIAEVKEIFGCKRGIARCIINAANAASQLDEFSYSDLLQRGLTIRTLGSALPKLAVKGYLDRIGPKTRTAARINEKGQKLVKVIRFLDDFCADPIGVVRGLSSDIPHNAYHEMFEIYQRDRVKPGDAIEKVTAALGDEPVLLSDLAERTGLKKGSIGNVLRDLKARGLVVNENRRWRRADKEQVTA
jgi:DNA-binding transcriptional ArsR family regulator